MSFNAAMGVDHPCDFTPDHSMESSSLHIISEACTCSGACSNALSIYGKDGTLAKS